MADPFEKLLIKIDKVIDDLDELRRQMPDNGWLNKAFNALDEAQNCLNEAKGTALN